MTNGISPENERFIEHAIAAGAFRDRGEVLNVALGLLKARQELLAHLEEGIQQLEAGEYTEYDEQSFRARFDQLEERALRQIETNRGPQ